MENNVLEEDIDCLSIEQINEGIKSKQKEILAILLDISRSFNDDNITKKQRNIMFEKVDSLRNDIKRYEIESFKKINSGEVIEINTLKECKKSIDENINSDDNNAKDYQNEKDNQIEEVDESESIQIETEKEEETPEYTEPVEQKTVDEEVENKEEEISEIEEDNDEYMKELDELIEKAQKSSSYDDDEEPDETEAIEENKCIKEKINKEENNPYNNNKEKVIENDFEKEFEIEKVPVLFGGNEQKNQMIIRKKENGISSLVKSLIFKLKNILKMD